MGMWEGLYTGLQNIRAKEEREMDREEARRIREEDMAFRREQFQFQQDTARRQMITDLYPLMKERSAAALKLSSQASILRGYLGDSPIIDTLVSTGNSEAVGRVIDNLEEGYLAAQKEGMGDEYLETWRTTLENDARITGATQGGIDFSLFEGVVTPEDLTALGLPTSFTTPGRIEVAPVIYQPRATLEDFNQIERSIASVAEQRARTEKSRIDSAIDRISTELRSTDIDPNRETLLRESQTTLMDRRQTIDGAIDLASGDNPSYFDLLNLYGNAATQVVVERSPRQVDLNLLSPAFTEAVSGIPITVTSADQAELFYRSGVIGENDMVMYNGRQYAVRDILTD
jgi:hypothetical protein